MEISEEIPRRKDRNKVLCPFYMFVERKSMMNLFADRQNTRGRTRKFKNWVRGVGKARGRKPPDAFNVLHSFLSTFCCGLQNRFTMIDKETG